jgi:uncharacterized membrane protein
MLTLNNPWLLAFSFFLHVVATVVWIGGLVTMALVVWPTLRRTIADSAAFGQVIEAIDKRFRPLANLSLAVLVITGLVQMNASPNYNGFLNLSNLWAQAILLKHLSIIGMIAVGMTMNFVIQPALRRNAMLATAGVSNTSEAAALRTRMDRLARVDLVLGILVLAFTAVARAQ